MRERESKSERERGTGRQRATKGERKRGRERDRDKAGDRPVDGLEGAGADNEGVALVVLQLHRVRSLLVALAQHPHQGLHVRVQNTFY